VFAGKNPPFCRIIGGDLSVKPPVNAVSLFAGKNHSLIIFHVPVRGKTKKKKEFSFITKSPLSRRSVGLRISKASVLGKVSEGLRTAVKKERPLLQSLAESCGNRLCRLKNDTVRPLHHAQKHSSDTKAQKPPTEEAYRKVEGGTLYPESAIQKSDHFGAGGNGTADALPLCKLSAVG